MRERYARIATASDPGSGSASETSCCGDVGCGSARDRDDPAASARRMGYSADDLAAVEAGANLGLGCGNPTAIAALEAGETALDRPTWRGILASYALAAAIPLSLWAVSRPLSGAVAVAAGYLRSGPIERIAAAGVYRAVTDAPIALEKAEGAALDRVEALLAANGLPHGDVRTAPAEFFLARADPEGEVVGVGGVESYGPDGLLRSVVVREPHRGRGYGTALCAALEEQARESGVERLYLLTATAVAFFRRRGYEPIPRENAPSSVRATTEFADLCPASATCMRRVLR